MRFTLARLLADKNDRKQKGFTIFFLNMLLSLPQGSRTAFYSRDDSFPAGRAVREINSRERERARERDDEDETKRPRHTCFRAG